MRDVASLGHIAIGVGAAGLHRAGDSRRRAWLKAALFWSALSFLPDADVVGFSLGVRYEDEWGHRGATHSLTFSIALGIAVGLAAPIAGARRLWTGVLATLVLTSHALLDTLTDGGLGCALLWPFDSTRYFAPWRPIPVAPIGLAFFSPYGMYVAATELVLFAPLWWFAAPRRWRAHLGHGTARLSLLAVIWTAALWMLLSEDPLRERVAVALLRDRTQFAPGYSPAALDSVRAGDTYQQVERRLGRPLIEYLIYAPDSQCVFVRIENGRVSAAEPQDGCTARQIASGMAKAPALDALGALGVPREHCWLYSRSPEGGYFRARAVCFDRGAVSAVVRRWLRE